MRVDRSTFKVTCNWGNVVSSSTIFFPNISLAGTSNLTTQQEVIKVNFVLHSWYPHLCKGWEGGLGTLPKIGSHGRGVCNFCNFLSRKFGYLGGSNFLARKEGISLKGGWRRNWGVDSWQFIIPHSSRFTVWGKS